MNNTNLISFSYIIEILVDCKAKDILKVFRFSKHDSNSRHAALNAHSIASNNNFLGDLFFLKVILNVVTEVYHTHRARRTFTSAPNRKGHFEF